MIANKNLNPLPPYYPPSGNLKDFVLSSKYIICSQWEPGPTWTVKTHLLTNVLFSPQDFDACKPRKFNYPHNPTESEAQRSMMWGEATLYIESNAEQKEMKSISNTCAKAHCWSANFSCHPTPAHCLGSARNVIHELKSYRKEPGQSITLVIRQLNERYKDDKQKEDRMPVDRNVLVSLLFLLHWNVWRRLSTLSALQVRQGRFNVISVIDI